jgi:hypothetical protein
MIAVVECEGAPRDLGHDQGLACGALLRDRYARRSWDARSRLRFGAARAGEGLARELARHFPRQAETLEGLAAAARVPVAWLVDTLERETASAEVSLAVAVSGARVGRVLAGEWILRRCRPEGGFRSIEVARPWLAHALLGVNEQGLAAAVVCGGAAGSPLPTAPLVQDCLQRFATVEACLDWCAGRPGDRPATLLLADASGEIAAIELGPGLRRVRRPAEGWLAVGATAELREAAGKTLREGGQLEAAAPAVFGWADTTARSLRLRDELYPA